MAIPPAVALAVTIGGSIISGIQQQNMLSAQMDAERQRARFEQQQLKMQMKREQVEKAIKETERERQLLIQLSSQRAKFGGKVDPFSGSPLRLQEVSISTLNREQAFADFITDQNILNLNVQTEQSKIGSQATINQIKMQKSMAMTKTATSLFSFGRQNSDLFGGSTGGTDITASGGGPGSGGLLTNY